MLKSDFIIVFSLLVVYLFLSLCSVSDLGRVRMGVNPLSQWTESFRYPLSCSYARPALGLPVSWRNSDAMTTLDDDSEGLDGR